MIGVEVSDFQHALRGNQGFTSRLLATLFTPVTLLVISSAFAFFSAEFTVPLGVVTPLSTLTDIACTLAVSSRAS